jgi:hypothetical protein
MSLQNEISRKLRTSIQANQQSPVCRQIRPHRFGGEGVLIGGQQQH